MTTQLDFFQTAPESAEFPVSARRLAYDETPAKAKRHEPTCKTCGLTWTRGCSEPHWSTVDFHQTGIVRCWRCWDEVCHSCYVRGGERSGDATLCPTCFALPTTMTLEECREHFYAHNGPDYVRTWLAWRYEEPHGQYVAITPAAQVEFQTYLAARAAGEITDEEDD